MLSKPSGLTFLPFDEHFFHSEIFTAFELTVRPLDLLVDLTSPRFLLLVQQANSFLHKLVGGTVLSSLNILLDQRLSLGLQMNGHRTNLILP